MGIIERKLREKEMRKTAIIDAAQHLFFSRNYQSVSMEDIAREVELNKATLYLYFNNKEALFATVVLRGIHLLREKYQGRMKTDTTGLQKVILMGKAYYQFSLECPEYLRLIHFYGSEQFSGENPYAEDIGDGYGTCRFLLSKAISEGIDDGTIKPDLSPYLTSMYLMIFFMNILSMEEKWKLAIKTEGFSYEQFMDEFYRFIIPALSPKY